jgi:hypothetical protein
LKTFVFYVSGHGFGHASRNIEVINALLARAEDLRVIVRTGAPRWLFERTVQGRDARGQATRAARFVLSPLVTDTGACQIDSLHLDEMETVRQAREFMHSFDARVESEARFLQEQEAHLVIADIPALGIAAANAAGRSSIGFGNFTWDWIYAAYESAHDVARQVGAAYATAALALRLPMHGGFETFTRVVDVPLVARRSRRDPADTRRVLGLPLDQRIVLVSFGG